MAVTLLEAAIEEKASDLSLSLIQMFDYYSPIFPEIPMPEIEGRAYEYQRVIQMPSAGWRAFNTAWTESSGQTDTYPEYGKILGGEVKIDVQLLKTQKDGGRKLKRTQTELKVQAAVNEWDRAFFEGSVLNSANEMIGLRSRLSGSQLLLMGSGGASLTLAKLRELVDAVPFSTRQSEGFKRGQGTRKVLYMNRTLRRKVDALIEAQTGSLRIETNRDAFGQNVEMFGDAIIRVVEQTGDGSTILGFDEDPDDGTADTASIYCCAYGEDLVHGFYNNGGGGRMLDTFTVEQMESEPRWLMRFEGYYGLAIDHPRAAARLYGVTNS